MCIIQFYYTISQTAIKHDFDIQLSSANQVVSSVEIALKIKTPNILKIIWQCFLPTAN